MRLDDVKVRAAAATPGPWEQGDWTGQCHQHGDGQHPGPPKCKYDYEKWDYEPDHLIRAAEPGVLVAGNYDYEAGGIIQPADATFIAHSRDDIDWLVARVEELSAALRETAIVGHDPTGTKWHHPGVRYRACSFDECEGPDCREARAALRNLEDAP